MNKVASIILTLGILAVSACSQSTTSTRPRVASTPRPPVITNVPATTRSEPVTPPVLNGRNRPGSIPSPTPPPTGGDDDEVIKIETNLVTMPVSVLDRDGRFISGLQQKDFKIFENGIEQKVDYFQSVEQPFSVILLIDVSPSTQFAIDEIQNAAISFINQLRTGDRVMVIAFDQEVQVLSPLTNNRNLLRNAVRQAQFGDGTGLYEAVDYVIAEQLKRIDGRKAVVLFSDGVDTTSRQATYDSTIRATEEIDALFYTLRYDTARDMGVQTGGGYPQRRGGGGGGSRNITLAEIMAGIIMNRNIRMSGGGMGGPGNAEYARGRQYLETLALNSGGRSFEAQSMFNLEAAFTGIAEELRRQYSLGYYPENVGKIGDRKQIKIRVMRPAVVVRAKNSYIVGQTDRTTSGR